MTSGLELVGRKEGVHLNPSFALTLAIHPYDASGLDWTGRTGPGGLDWTGLDWDCGGWLVVLYASSMDSIMEEAPWTALYGLYGLYGDSVRPSERGRIILGRNSRQGEHWRVEISQGDDLLRSRRHHVGSKLKIYLLLNENGDVDTCFRNEDW